LARAVFVRLKPALVPRVHRFRQFLFVEQEQRFGGLQAQVRDTATWANQQQLQATARMLSEVQTARRMVLDRHAAAAAEQAAMLKGLANEVAALRGALVPVERDENIELVLPGEGGTVVYVGRAAPASLDVALNRVGSTGRIAVAGIGTAVDSIFTDVSIDVLRIAAPGEEAEVLRGAKRTLALGKAVIVARFDAATLRARGYTPDGWLAIFADAGLHGEHAGAAVSEHSLKALESADVLFRKRDGGQADGLRPSAFA
jgi:hypothetical protein